MSYWVLAFRFYYHRILRRNRRNEIRPHTHAVDSETWAGAAHSAHRACSGAGLAAIRRAGLGTPGNWPVLVAHTTTGPCW